MTSKQKLVAIFGVCVLSLILTNSVSPTLGQSQEGENDQGAEPADAGIAPCGAEVIINWERPFSTLEEIAWSSHQVVVGTVVEELPSQFGKQLAPEIDPAARHVVTDYILRVDSQLRGHEMDQIRVRRLGGSVDGCTVTEYGADESRFAVGDQLLVFLHSEDPTAISQPGAVYKAMGPEGIWRVDSSGAVHATSEFNSIGALDDPGLAAIVPRIVSSLRSGEPPEQLGSRWVIPLERAPVPSNVDISSTQHP